jgi:hypothetical protein
MEQASVLPRVQPAPECRPSLFVTGDIAESWTYYNQANALYDPAEHRQLATRFAGGQDVRVALLSYRSLALSVLGYPDDALGDTEQALSDAREIGQATTLLYALGHAALAFLQRGDQTRVSAIADELVALADEKGAFFWKAYGMMEQGCVLAVIGKASEAVQLINSGIAAFRSTGATFSRSTYHIWQGPMPPLTNSTTPGAALAKR